MVRIVVGVRKRVSCFGDPVDKGACFAFTLGKRIFKTGSEAGAVQQRIADDGCKIE